jgi:hypothetical protein
MVPGEKHRCTGCKSTIEVVGAGQGKHDEVWLGLTLLFEIGLGRIVLQYSWARILSDYNIRHGGPLPFGLVVLTCAPPIAARLRAIQPKPVHAIAK